MDEKTRRVHEDPDFVNLKKYGFSLTAVREAHPGGCSPALRARALMMGEDEADRMYAAVVAKLRRGVMAPQEREEIERRLLMELYNQVQNYIGAIEAQGDPIDEKEARILRTGKAFMRALAGEPDLAEDRGGQEGAEQE